MIAYTQEETSVKTSYFGEVESLPVFPAADCLVTRLLTNGTGALGKLRSGARRGLYASGERERGREGGGGPRFLLALAIVTPGGRNTFVFFWLLII